MVTVPSNNYYVHRLEILKGHISLKTFALKAQSIKKYSGPS